jgi:hypothetical protein
MEQYYDELEKFYDAYGLEYGHEEQYFDYDHELNQSQTTQDSRHTKSSASTYK